MCKVWIVALAIGIGGSAGCSDSAKNADPKPVNVKEDPRLKREVPGSVNKAGEQISNNK